MNAHKKIFSFSFSIIEYINAKNLSNKNPSKSYEDGSIKKRTIFIEFRTMSRICRVLYSYLGCSIPVFFSFRFDVIPRNVAEQAVLGTIAIENDIEDRN